MLKIQASARAAMPTAIAVSVKMDEKMAAGKMLPNKNIL